MEPGEGIQPRDLELFHHPWMNTSAYPLGLVPFADVLNDSEGRRYAAEEGFQADDVGDPVPFSAIVTLDVRQMTATERSELEAEAALQDAEFGLGTITPYVYNKLDEALLAKIAGLGTVVRDIDVIILLEHAEQEPLFVRLQKAMALAEIYDRASYDARRAQEILDRADAVRVVQDAVVPLINSYGGTVTSVFTNYYAVRATVPSDQLVALGAQSSIRKIGISVPMDLTANVTGLEVVKGSQINLAVTSGYDGENNTATDIGFAVIEADNYHDEHPGFRDGTGTATRISARRYCTPTSCSPVTNFGAPFHATLPHHSTAVAGLIFGDLRDGQDASVTDPTERIKRSGYAPEAWGELYRVDSNSNSVINAIDDMVSLIPPEIVNSSVANSKNGPVPDDPTCSGTSLLNQWANYMYEDGTTLVQSAGNETHTSSTSCEVNSPGAAIGVFTVGSHGTAIVGTEASVRTGAISPTSPRGGTASQGGGRSIIDLTAFSYRSMMFDRTGGYTYTANGTSFATPTVTAAFINFLDFWHQANPGSIFLEDPGARYVNMLLMGDRTQETATKMTTRYSNLWGAGRLKMRINTAAGMDTPALWKTSSVCVKHGEIVEVKINSGATLSTAVNDLKATIFWYDRRHQFGQAPANIDLRLRTTSGTSLLSSLSTTDNKERVFYDAAGGKALKLEIIGTNVTSSQEGCGVNGMLVYYAYFYEDDARDDPEGPKPTSATVIDPE